MGLLLGVVHWFEFAEFEPVPAFATFGFAFMQEHPVYTRGVILTWNKR